MCDLRLKVILLHLNARAFLSLIFRLLHISKLLYKTFAFSKQSDSACNPCKLCEPREKLASRAASWKFDLSERLRRFSISILFVCLIVEKKKKGFPGEIEQLKI